MRSKYLAGALRRVAKFRTNSRPSIKSYLEKPPGSQFRILCESVDDLVFVFPV